MQMSLAGGLRQNLQLQIDEWELTQLLDQLEILQQLIDQ
jgi:hypothetical protein